MILLMPLSDSSSFWFIGFSYSSNFWYLMDSSTTFTSSLRELTRSSYTFLYLSAKWPISPLSIFFSLSSSFKPSFICSIALVKRFVSKSSSNIFLRVELSAKGHNDSSWWQNTMFYKIGLVIPRNSGICLSISAHLWFIYIYSFFSSFVFRDCSEDLKDNPFPVAWVIHLFFAIIWRPFAVLNRRKTVPTVSGFLEILGSITKYLPRSELGGNDPVVMYLRL